MARFKHLWLASNYAMNGSKKCRLTDEESTFEVSEKQALTYRKGIVPQTDSQSLSN